MDVAIKELKIETQEAQTKIKAEADLMQKLDHQHVIKFLGICMDTQMTSLKIVLEYAPLGDLKSYFEKNNTPSKMPMYKIVKLCYQIALAMEYLASKSVVHRDLAARNVLLISEDCCKVTDFGLSRATNNYNYYTHRVTNDSLLPLKWYPLELIRATVNDLKFNEKTDVWSFGVTCWEATSYGKLPYGNMSMALVENALENGRKPLGKFSRLYVASYIIFVANIFILFIDRPEHCSNQMYHIMLKCWELNQSERPTFAQILKEFQKFININ